MDCLSKTDLELVVAFAEDKKALVSVSRSLVSKLCSAVWTRVLQFLAESAEAWAEEWSHQEQQNDYLNWARNPDNAWAFDSD